jgi:hypothetical protein
MGVVDADVVTVVVPEPMRLRWFTCSDHGMLHLLASWGMFGPHSLTSGGVRTLSVVRDTYQMLRKCIKGGESSRWIHIPHSSSSCADPSHPFCFLSATASCNGVQPSSLTLLHAGRPYGAGVGAWMAGAGVRGLAALWHCSSL